MIVHQPSQWKASDDDCNIRADSYGRKLSYLKPNTSVACSELLGLQTGMKDFITGCDVPTAKIVQPHLWCNPTQAISEVSPAEVSGIYYQVVL